MRYEAKTKGALEQLHHRLSRCGALVQLGTGRGRSKAPECQSSWRGHNLSRTEDQSIAAETMISTFQSGRASFASHVARAGGLSGSTHSRHASFMAANSRMSLIQI